MLAQSRPRVAACSSSIATLPYFLVSALAASAPAPWPAPRRSFSVTTAPQSKLGRTPISIPPGVELTVGEPYVISDYTAWKQIPRRNVSVAGPLGKLDLNVPLFVKMDYNNESRRLVLSIEDRAEQQQKAMWGTTWAYLHRYIIGVSEGYTTVLNLVGIGYRASIDKRPKLAEYPDQDFVCLRLGFSHPVDLGCPKGVKASTPSPTRILLEGINLEELNQFAARIRMWRVPEPYKGKGIFVNDETIKLKQKKIK